MRVRQREKAYSIATLKEYVPDYESRAAYFERRNKSEFRRTLLRDHPGDQGPSRSAATSRSCPAQLVPAATEAGQAATERLNVLLTIEKRLRVDARSSATASPTSAGRPHYDLMLAQIVAYQVKAYEYRACLPRAGQDAPQAQASCRRPTLSVEWDIDHSTEPQGPQGGDREEVRRGRRACSSRSSSATPRPPGPTSPRTSSTAASAASAASGTTTRSTTSGPSSCPKY